MERLKDIGVREPTRSGAMPEEAKPVYSMFGRGTLEFRKWHSWHYNSSSRGDSEAPYSRYSTYSQWLYGDRLKAFYHRMEEEVHLPQHVLKRFVKFGGRCKLTESTIARYTTIDGKLDEDQLLDEREAERFGLEDPGCAWCLVQGHKAGQCLQPTPHPSARIDAVQRAAIIETQEGKSWCLQRRAIGHSTPNHDTFTEGTPGTYITRLLQVMMERGGGCGGGEEQSTQEEDPPHVSVLDQVRGTRRMSVGGKGGNLPPISES